MAQNDIISDVITRIRNAQLAFQEYTVVPCSKFVLNFLEVLKNEGFINSFEAFFETDHKKMVKVDLKYYKKKPVISHISRVSKPSRRMYAKRDNLPKNRHGLGVYIISTPKGLMTDHQAREEFLVGGEVLCSVF